MLLNNSTTWSLGAVVGWSQTSRISRAETQAHSSALVKGGSIPLLSSRDFSTSFGTYYFNELLVTAEQLFIPVSRRRLQGAKAGRWAVMSPQVHSPANKGFPAGLVPGRSDPSQALRTGEACGLQPLGLERAHATPVDGAS